MTSSGCQRTILYSLWLGRVSGLDKADLSPLIRVLARLIAANPSRGILLVLAGSSFEDTGRVLQTFASASGVAESVRIVGDVDPLDAHIWHSAADVFISPADNSIETFGITPIEAMACGIPQIVSDWSGYRDTVIHGDTGFLVPTRWNGGGISLETEAGLHNDSWEVGYKLAQVMAVDLDALQLSIQTLIDNEPLRLKMANASRRRALDHYDWGIVVREHMALWERLAAIANADRTPPCDVGYSIPRFFDCFGHYASRRLASTTRVRLTAEMLDTAGSFVQPPTHPFLENCIDQDLVANLRATLQGGALSDGSAMTVYALMSATGKNGVESESQEVARHVLWMAKHGMVALHD